jgi:23S rRNA G2069 N7-methylase RlmK/C1962 C5-methylase RlmI
MNDPAPAKFRDPALVDFGADAAGHGRRLERLGGVLVDRPLPHAVGPRHTPHAVVLSLFGHSGAATLALAAAGAEVVHVDASRQALALARRNAEASGLDHLPIRWIHDDAADFVRRQVRRGRGFSGAVIDPPSWGHGPRGEAFAIDRDLPPLLDDVAGLLVADSALPRGPLLLTSHSPGWHPRRLRETLLAACGRVGLPAPAIEDGQLECHDDAGRPLALGSFARCLPHP